MEMKTEVYFLPIKRANQLAASHDKDMDWDIWSDEKAKVLGNVYKVLKAHEEKGKHEKAV